MDQGIGSTSLSLIRTSPQYVIIQLRTCSQSHDSTASIVHIILPHRLLSMFLRLGRRRRYKTPPFADHQAISSSLLLWRSIGWGWRSWKPQSSPSLSSATFRSPGHDRYRSRTPAFAIPVLPPIATVPQLVVSSTHPVISDIVVVVIALWAIVRWSFRLSW